MLRGEGDGVREHVKLGEGRSEGDVLPVLLHVSGEGREGGKLRRRPGDLCRR